MTRYMKAVFLLVTLSLLLAFGSSALAAPIYTHDFEALPAGVSEAEALQMTPFGWTGSGGGQLWKLNLSNEMAYSGKYSMKVVVDPDNDPFGVHLSSQPIPVTPGKEYTASIMVYNVTQPPYNARVDLYVEFWPEGGWWGEEDFWSLETWRSQEKGAWKNQTRLHSVAKSSPMDKWAEITATSVAPADAKYMTVGFWTSRRVVISYIDDVWVDEN